LLTQRNTIAPRKAATHTGHMADAPPREPPQPSEPSDLRSCAEGRASTLRSCAEGRASTEPLPGASPPAPHGTGCYVLNILTHGRRYSEEYEQLADAISAALALEHEPRERAESICKDGVVCVDRAELDELARVGCE
jgi:hypothetical protein